MKSSKLWDLMVDAACRHTNADREEVENGLAACFAVLAEEMGLECADPWSTPHKTEDLLGILETFARKGGWEGNAVVRRGV